MVVNRSGKQLQATEYCTPKFHYESGIAILDTSEGPIMVSIFGWHNLLNLEAARNVCNELGVSNTDFYKAITSFTGAARRLERLFEKNGVLAFRDFAHAPSKLKATISAVREALPSHRVIGVFELHTFSSLNAEFLKQYEGAMKSADDAIVFYSHHALELKKLPALQPTEVEKHFAQEGLIAVDNKEALIAAVKDRIKGAGEKPVCLLLMSSGTFEGIDWEQEVVAA
jgi:UDP-N-acetylmuramate: L-alanyl-gamma-D-glutamyl-meso-diaminopimelate ligase